MQIPSSQSLGIFKNKKDKHIKRETNSPTPHVSFLLIKGTKRSINIINKKILLLKNLNIINLFYF